VGATSTIRNQTSHPNVLSRKPSITPTTISTIQRKPKVTYRSPSALIPTELRVEASVSHALILKKVASSSSSSYSSSASSTPTSESILIPTSSRQPIEKNTIWRKKYPMAPPLPLYHPLGRLALSLPELEPASLGLPVPMRIDDSIRRASSRARRPAAKLREAEVEDGSTEFIPENTMAVTTGISSAGAATNNAPAREVKERTSPRKRRSVGGGGARRRRRETDDGDSTYPAKRSRNLRGSAGGVGNTAREASIGVESGMRVEDTTGIVATAATNAIGYAEEKKPERRSMRSRGLPKRRGSSASETTATSVGGSTSVVGGKKIDGNNIVAV
jgi:hypothetical protein